MATVDDLRDKWNAITPRERLLVALLGVSLVVCVVGAVVMSIADRLDRMAAANQEMRKALVVLADYRLRGRPDAPAAGDVAIPEQPVKLESYLDKAAQKVGISVPSYRPRSQPKGDVTVHTVDLNVAGLSMDQAKDFLEAIESENRLVTVTALSMKPNFADKQKLDLELEVSTYARPAPQPGAAAAPGAPAAPAAPGGAP
jgi:Tfp pilus assembly protein PilO